MKYLEFYEINSTNKHGVGRASSIFTTLITTLLNLLQAASNSWGLSVGFTSVILLPIVGNAVEHAGAIIFAFRNKLVSIHKIKILNFALYSLSLSKFLCDNNSCIFVMQDITLGVALGSATQISMFVVWFSTFTIRFILKFILFYFISIIYIYIVTEFLEKISGSSKCDNFLDNWRKNGSWFQPSRNRCSYPFDTFNSIHVTGN